MAIKTWETDYRYPAIQASIRALADSGRDDPFSHPGSFCLPVGRKPFVGWTLGRFMLIVTVLGLAWMIVPCLLLFLLNAQGPIGYALAFLVICCFLAALLTLLSPFLFFERVVRWLIGGRVDALLRQSQFAQALGAEVFDGAKSRMALLMSMIGTGEGALLLFDEQNRRVMIEGLGGRYQIRAADVEEVSPFFWRFSCMAYIGARITYLIDSETRLQLLIVNQSLIAQYLPWYITMPWLVPNKLFDNSLRTLQPADVTAVQEAPST